MNKIILIMDPQGSKIIHNVFYPFMREYFPLETVLLTPRVKALNPNKLCSVLAALSYGFAAQHFESNAPLTLPPPNMYTNHVNQGKQLLQSALAYIDLAPSSSSPSHPLTGKPFPKEPRRGASGTLQVMRNELQRAIQSPVWGLTSLCQVAMVAHMLGWPKETLYTSFDRPHLQTVLNKVLHRSLPERYLALVHYYNDQEPALWGKMMTRPKQ